VAQVSEHHAHPDSTLTRTRNPGGHDGPMMAWEYLIMALPSFGAPTVARGDSAAVHALDELGEQGWEAVGMTVLDDGNVAVLLKRLKKP
jgi:hypothetical protein